MSLKSENMTAVISDLFLRGDVSPPHYLTVTVNTSMVTLQRLLMSFIDTDGVKLQDGSVGFIRYNQ